jgi:type IV fimbrial biogenesis protein FimT
MKILRQQGFTIVELMITVGIAGIVLMIAVPNMSEFIKNERLTTATNTLISDLMLARSKAVEMNQPVILCPSSNQTSCTETDYDDGWIVWVDGNNDGIIESGDLIKVQQALGNDVYIKNEGVTTIKFNEKGFTPDRSNADILSVCDSRKDTHAKAITLSKTGRVNRGGSPSC